MLLNEYFLHVIFACNASRHVVRLHLENYTFMWAGQKTFLSTIMLELWGYFCHIRLICQDGKGFTWNEFLPFLIHIVLHTVIPWRKYNDLFIEEEDIVGHVWSKTKSMQRLCYHGRHCPRTEFCEDPAQLVSLGKRIAPSRPAPDMPLTPPPPPGALLGGISATPSPPSASTPHPQPHRGLVSPLSFTPSRLPAPPDDPRVSAPTLRFSSKSPDRSCI